MEFSDQAAFRNWLSNHASNTPGVWLKIYKKDSGMTTVSHLQALDEALCFGWIDGQRKGFDEKAFLQKFTPRRPKSLWSKKNRENIERLTATGVMTEAGLHEVEIAKADGRWDAAYDQPGDMQIPQFFLDELEKHPKAKELYATLNKTNLFAIGWRLQTARTDETRKRRTDKIIAMLDDGQKIH